MKNLFRLLLPVTCLLAFVAGGCSSAYTGLSGNTMYSDGIADIAIAPVNGMGPVAHGSYVGNMPSDSINDPSARVRYAIYGDTGSQSVKRHAHVIFTELTDKASFVIMPETFAGPTDLDLSSVKLDRRDWKVHTFYERRQGDWFTEFWDVNGYLTPEVWLGKRWTRLPDSGTRVVAEYREPLPACAAILDKTSVIFNNVTIDMATPECRREVSAVLERADRAFSMRRPATINTNQPAPSEALSLKPDRDIDLKRYVGISEYIPNETED
jgi:hypothetical protein